MKLTRNEFLKTLGPASAAAVAAKALGAANHPDSGPALQGQSPKPVATKANIMLGVSLYSYQHALYTGEMTLEDCLAELNSIGAQGLQIIDEITIPNFPNPPEPWVNQWFQLCDKYNLVPTNMNSFVDVYWGWRHKPMDLQEQIDVLTTRLKLAKRLGFTVVRPTSGPVSEPVGQLFERIVPIAEDLNVKVAPELHAPIPLQPDSAFLGRILETIHKTGTKHLGFTLDMGDLPIPFSKEKAISSGELTGNIASYIEDAKAKGAALEDVQAKVKTMNPKQGDLIHVYRVYGIRPTPGTLGLPQGMTNTLLMMTVTVRNAPKDVFPLIPYIYNVHGKFYMMTEGLVETTLNYEDTFKVLVEGGYDGSIDSEYEGQRHMQNQWCEPINEVEQVRRHHLMMRKLLGRA
jgi:sugar phosphate isomerase/epimerase